MLHVEPFQTPHLPQVQTLINAHLSAMAPGWALPEAYIAGKLDAIQEGERTALDNSMLLFCSSMLTGQHDASQLPVVVLGRGGGKLQTGRVLDYREKANRQMCRLYLSMMDKMDVRLDKFGDAGEPLSEV